MSEEQTEHVNCLSSTQSAVEKEIFGERTVRMRDYGGMFAAFTVCLTALFNSYVIFLSVSTKGEWPSETSMFIMMVGPILISWSWMSVNKTLQTLLSGGDSMTKLRSRVANLIAPRAPEPPPEQDQQARA